MSMTVKTTLSFTDRHHTWLSRKVEEGVFATASAAVAAAVEAMMEEERVRTVALDAMADEIRARLATPPESFLDIDETFAPARRALGDASA
jgi:Arc/MetJ-type ribon-helix-helix transcriptional regulator